LKIKNIPTLTYPTSIKKRDEWLRDLSRAFEAAPKKFRSQSKQILFALDYLDTEGRAKWDRYLDDQSEQNQQAAKQSWERFKEWSQDLLRDATNRELNLITSINNATQRYNQSPLEFHNYFDSLEKQEVRKSESERANLFFAKLYPDFRDHMKLNLGTIPETREGMVQIAERMWEPWIKMQRKRKNEGKDNENPSKYQRSDNQSRGRGTYRGRGNYRGGGGSFNPEQSQTKDREPPKPKENSDVKQRNPTGYNGRFLKCFNCQSTYHLAKDCPQPQGSKDQSNRKPWAKAQEVTAQESKNGNQSE
jgi:hypothetical protein